MLFLSQLHCGSFYFEGFGSIQEGLLVHVKKKKEGENPEETETRKTGVMLGFGTNIGYRVDLDQWFFMFNLIGGQISLGSSKAKENSSIHIILPTQVKVGRYIGKGFSLYGVINPLSLMYMGALNKKSIMNVLPSGVTLGLGTFWRFSNAGACFFEMQMTHEYGSALTDPKELDLPFSKKPFYMRALFGFQLSTKPTGV